MSKPYSDDSTKIAIYIIGFVVVLVLLAGLLAPLFDDSDPYINIEGLTNEQWTEIYRKAFLDDLRIYEDGSYRLKNGTGGCITNAACND